MQEFDNRISEGLYYGRPDTAVPVLVDSFVNYTEDDYLVGYHLCVVKHPIRVIGYQIAGQVITVSTSGGDPPPPVNNNSKWRFGMLRGHARLGVPTGSLLRNSDTGARIVYAAGEDFREAVRVMPIVMNAVEYVCFMLKNPVLIEEPGLYWICIARRDQLDLDEKYYGSYVPAYLRGMRDLITNQNVSNLESLDFAALVTIETEKPLNEQKFLVPDEFPTTLSICNIDVGLITQRWPK